MKQLPPQDVLHRLLDYDPATGEFTWKPRGVSWWDRRFSGKPAFPCLNIGYRVGSLCGKQGILAHRAAYKYMTGVDADGEVDHINGNRADNRWANLRLVSSTGNHRNAAKPSHNTSGCVGVHFKKAKRKWVAFISLNNRYTHLGYFTDKEQAIARRKAAEREHGFHPNHGRTA